MVRIRRRVKRKLMIGFVIFIFLGLIVGGSLFVVNYFHNKEQARIQAEKDLLATIESKYNDIVEITKDTILYEKKDDKYLEVGSIAAGEVVSLEKEDISINTKYFKLKDLGYYVKYQDVKKADKLLEKSDRYKNYILFNENVVSKKKVKLYRNDKLVYTMNEAIDKPIVMKDDKGYFIEYLNELLFISNDDVEKTYASNNTNLEEASGVPVTVYHFIYLAGESFCNENICHPESQIREHFNYLSENKFFTLTTTELRLYIENKLRVPKKSILITIDDGSTAWNFIPLLEEYKINATLFLISGWYELNRYKSSYLELASHTHELHTPGVCAGGQGSPLKCLDKAKLIADLNLSRTVLNNTEAFCFPFYEYNDYAISVLQEAGFKMAFIGGYRKAVKGDYLFKVPRIPLNRYTTLSQYASYVN